MTMVDESAPADLHPPLKRVVDDDGYGDYVMAAGRALRSPATVASRFPKLFAFIEDSLVKRDISTDQPIEPSALRLGARVSVRILPNPRFAFVEDEFWIDTRGDPFDDLKVGAESGAEFFDRIAALLDAPPANAADEATDEMKKRDDR